MKLLPKFAQVLFFALSGSLLGSLSGCVPQNNSVQTSISERVARALVAGRAYDRGLLAARAGDAQSLERARQELQRADGEDWPFGLPAISPAEAAIDRAMDAGVRAETGDEAAKARWRKQEASEYRAALSLQMETSMETSRDANRLNAVGYFLAERGQNMADFTRGEKLVRASLAIWKRAIVTTRSTQKRLYYRLLEANTRDSLAWALFRQRRLEAAAREQEGAIAQMRAVAREARDLTPSLTTGAAEADVSPELLFHLGAIYQAQNRPEEAKAQFQNALKIDPNFAPAREALQQKGVSAQPSAFGN